MNTTLEQDRRQHDTFVDLVDFKWLMAGVGWWVNLSRLQCDQSYADECPRRAQSSGSQLLRERASCLLGTGTHDDDREPLAQAALAVKRLRSAPGFARVPPPARVAPPTVSQRCSSGAT